MRRWIAIVALLVGCERAEEAPKPPPDPLAGVELPEVSGAGSIAGEARSPLVIATPSALALDGTSVLALRDGAVAAADKEGGLRGMRIPTLTTRFATVAGAADKTATLAMDRRLTYRLLVEILFSAKQREAGWKRFALLARASGDKLVAFPITLPDKAPASASLGGRIEKLEETSLSASDVLAKIRRTYMAGIKRCYKQLLAKERGASGKLMLRLTVSGSGRVTKASAGGIPAMESCVTAAMATWQFPVPHDPDGKPADATFQIALYLASDDSAVPIAPGTAILPPPEHLPIAPPEDPAEIDPRICIAITKTELVLWSFTGLEGTLANPKLAVARSDATALAKLGAGLEEIVRRRWGNRARPETTRTVVILADGTTPVQTVAEVFGVARTAFPDLLLSSGFE